MHLMSAACCCACSVVAAPQFPSGWKPKLEPSTYSLLRRGAQLLRNTAIIRATSGKAAAAGDGRRCGQCWGTLAPHSL